MELSVETFASAQEFLTKPFRDQELLDAIQRAIARHRVVRRQRAELAALRRRDDALTPRERDVIQRVVAPARATGRSRPNRAPAKSPSRSTAVK
jgi:FixJ family two-component response regulator